MLPCRFHTGDLRTWNSDQNRVIYSVPHVKKASCSWPYPCSRSSGTSSKNSPAPGARPPSRRSSLRNPVPRRCVRRENRQGVERLRGGEKVTAVRRVARSRIALAVLSVRLHPLARPVRPEPLNPDPYPAPNHANRKSRGTPRNSASSPKRGRSAFMTSTSRSR